MSICLALGMLSACSNTNLTGIAGKRAKDKDPVDASPEPTGDPDPDTDLLTKGEEGLGEAPRERVKATCRSMAVELAGLLPVWRATPEFKATCQEEALAAGSLPSVTIDSVEGLASIEAGKSYSLARDLTLPAGFSAPELRNSTFNGNGHVIFGLTLDNPSAPRGASLRAHKHLRLTGFSSDALESASVLSP